MSTLPLFESDPNQEGPLAKVLAKTTDRRRKKIETMLADPSAPIEMRLEVLQQLSRSEDEAAAPILTNVLEAASLATGEDQYREKILELGSLIQQMQQGPLQCALFDRMLAEPDLGRRAQVILPDGTLASPVVPDDALAAKLRCGDTVWIEAKGHALIARAPESTAVGDEATLERVLPNGNLRVRLGEVGHAVFRAAGRLVEQIAAGEAGPGSTVVVCPRRTIAFFALPEHDQLDHYQYLSREAVPDVVVERDIGSPPAFIGRLTRHLRRELADPTLSDRYGLRRSRLTLLSGIPGSGKTYGIDALHNAIYRIMSEVTKTPVGDLPPRVMRLRSAEVLSKWLGQSDKQLARFFKEVDQIAAEPFVAPDGRAWQLPLLVIAEEIDGLARARGEDGVHDRLLATLLEGLDPGRPTFRDRLVFFVATTNTSHLVDMAVIRRIGGQIESFGHMDQHAFRAVLAKHLASRPFRFEDENSRDAEAARARAIIDIATWFYGPNSNAPGQVEITFVGQATSTPHFHRDFFTAGLIDRAIQDASEEAAHHEHTGKGPTGLDATLVVRAIHRQVRHIVDLLTPLNCDKYLTLPDAERVATLRRIDQPPVVPFEFERTS